MDEPNRIDGLVFVGGYASEADRKASLWLEGHNVHLSPAAAQIVEDRLRRDPVAFTEFLRKRKVQGASSSTTGEDEAMGEAKAKEELRNAASKAHYDLDQAETAMRGHLATAQEALKAECENDDQRAFLAANMQFDEARIQFTLGGMRSVNEGIDRDNMLIAGGRAIGMMMADLMGVCIGNRERMNVDRAIKQAVAEAVARQSTSQGVKMEPMESGHA